MEAKLTDVLKQNRLSVTESRKKILYLFFKQPGALAHADIERSAGEKFDRVTVYRTLQTFVEKGIIHVIPTSDSEIRYALCKEECREGHHHDNHLHFVCLECGSMNCLAETALPEVKLPRGYQVKQVEVLVKGVCKTCQSQTSVKK